MAASLDALLAPADQARVVEAVRGAEASSTGQIRVHLDERCPGEALARAQQLFSSLRLQETRRRNAVLIYVAPRDRRFAIVGDQGIHERGGQALWERAAASMREAFARGALGDGLCAAIAEAGAVLARDFPRDGSEGENEIPDTISTGDR